MKLNSATTKAAYNGEGSATVFLANFVLLNSGDAQVVRRSTSNAETLGTEGWTA